MTKQDVVAKSYGKHWPLVQKLADENGWVNEANCGEMDFELYGAENLEHREQVFKDGVFLETAYFVRPISLKGIETNNGWFKIESAKDFPKREGNFWIKTIHGKNSFQAEYDAKEKCFRAFSICYKNSKKEVTHYQPVVTPLDEIY